MGNVVGLDAERLLNDPRGAVAVVAVDRLFEKLGRLATPKADGERRLARVGNPKADGATVGSVPDSSVVYQPHPRGKDNLPMKSERTGAARHNQALARQLPSSKYRGGLSNGCWFERREHDLIGAGRLGSW
jgi:hypothetical protein